jgi:hypothetical protein
MPSGNITFVIKKPAKKMTIPRLVFIILYNGKEELPAKMTLRLSDLFTEVPGYDKIQLELEVTVYNINKGKNPGIEGKSETLDGYMELMARIRGNEQGGLDTKNAVSEAVRYCKTNGILYDFLCKYGSEVENMLINDYSMADILKFCKEDAWEGGREERAWEIARDLKSLGLAAEQISRATKLPVEEISAL